MSLDTLAQKITKAAGVSVPDLKGRARSRPLPFVRHLFMWAATARGFSYSEIGRWMDKDHSSVIFGVKKITRFLGPPAPVDAEIEMAVMMQAAGPPVEVPDEAPEAGTWQRYSVLEDGLIIALVGFGYGSIRIGRFLDRSWKAIEKRRKTIGAVGVHPRSKRKDLDAKIEREWLNGNKSMREIGIEYGAKKGVVAGVINRRKLMGRKGTGYAQ